MGPGTQHLREDSVYDLRQHSQETEDVGLPEAVVRAPGRSRVIRGRPLVDRDSERQVLPLAAPTPPSRPALLCSLSEFFKRVRSRCSMREGEDDEICGRVPLLLEAEPDFSFN